MTRRQPGHISSRPEGKALYGRRNQDKNKKVCPRPAGIPKIYENDATQKK